MSENKDCNVDHVLPEVHVPAKQLVFGAMGMLTKSFLQELYTSECNTGSFGSSDVDNPSVLYVGSIFQNHDHELSQFISTRVESHVKHQIKTNWKPWTQPQ